MNLTYLIGEPGAGKSSLFAALTEGVPYYARKRPFAMTVWGEHEVVELGEKRIGFPGTDTLSMSVQPRVIEWLEFEQAPLVMGEGDRLATDSFFTNAAALGYEVTVVLLSVPEAVAEERRAARATALGAKPQNAAWAAGRRTKVRRLAESWASVTLDGSRPIAEVASEAMKLPVFSSLRKESV